MNKSNLSISNFNKNALFIGKLVLFLLWVVGYIVHLMPQYEGSYTAALVDKVERLKNTEGPKIVLLGNSNLAFGIDSKMLEEEFGMPVVNMGLHGGLGNRFHENMAKYNIHEGDIYIVSHTVYSDDDTLGDATLAWTVIEDHYELWKLLEWKDAKPMLEAFPTYLKKCLDLYALGTGNEDNGGYYSRRAFNEYGDIGLVREETKYSFEYEIWPAAVNKVATNRLNELNHFLKERGAVLLVASYPIGKGELTVGEEKYKEAQTALEKELECPMISDYTDYFFSYDYFYDTDFHLTTEGAVCRTEQLIKDINQWKEQIQ